MEKVKNLTSPSVMEIEKKSQESCSVEEDSRKSHPTNSIISEDLSNEIFKELPKSNAGAEGVRKIIPAKLNLPRANRMGSARKTSKNDQKGTYYKNTKYVSYDVMKKLSDGNLQRFNQNLNYELLESQGYNLKDGEFTFIRIMDHFHFRGEPIAKHYRCLVYTPNNDSMGLQDVSIEQWDSLPIAIKS